MSTTVTVAPREIRDLAYMAGRVVGCDAGTAERIADNVTFAETHHGAAVSTFCDALEAGNLPGSVWGTAPDALLAAEVAARSGNSASVAFEPPVPLGAIAEPFNRASSEAWLPRLSMTGPVATRSRCSRVPGCRGHTRRSRLAQPAAAGRFRRLLVWLAAPAEPPRQHDQQRG